MCWSSFFQDHGDGSFGAYQCTDAASLAVIIVDHDPARFRISCDTEIRTEEAAHVTPLACLSPQTAVGLCNGLACDPLFLGGTEPLAVLRDP